MIAAWMLHTIAVTLLLLAGAAAAEYVARSFRAPTRVVWAVVMIAALGLSARALIMGLDGPREAATSVSDMAVRAGVATLDGADSAATLSMRGTGAPGVVSRFRDAASRSLFALGRITQAGARVDVRPFDRWNGLLLALWFGASLSALGVLVTSYMRVRRMELTLTLTKVRDHSVLVSRDLGPVVLGVLRSRIVLPEWVLKMPGRERDVILAHEREHAAAYDPALIMAALFMLALQPWNIALWSLISRLRMAIEGDCDRRVLDAIGDDGARWYGRLLILVYEKTTLNPALSIGFVTRPSNLERRIRRIVIKPRVTSIAGVTSLLSAAALVVAACSASAPVRRESQSPVPESNVAGLPSERPAPPGIGVQTHLTSAARDADYPRETRCSLTARRTASQHTVLWPGQWPVNAGCSIYGDIIVVYVDSTNLLVAARDTADAGITAFFVFQTEPGTTTSDLAWSTTAGRAELTDSTMSFSGPVVGARPVVIRLRATQGAATRTDVLELKVDQMMMSEMRGIPWETIAQLPGSPQCTATERASETMPNAGRNPSTSGTADELRRACFVTRGSRFQFAIL